MNSSVAEYAGLRCHIVDALADGSSPETVVILCHGFGAPGHDLVPFGPELLDCSPDIAARCRFVFPEAPVSLTAMGIPGGRAWWPINMAALAEINQTQEFEKLTALTPPGMQEASQQLADGVRQIQAACGLTDTQTVLGGFSQGAMVTTNITLQHGFVPRQLLLFSGTLLCSETWTAAAEQHPGCPVLQSHGRQDPVLPYPPAESLRDMLTQHGFDVTFRPFDGPHTIPPQVIEDMAKILRT